MSDPTLPPDEEVRTAADILVECYGAGALGHARLLEELSTAQSFARSVSAALERRLAQTARDIRPGEPSGA